VTVDRLPFTGFGIGLRAPHYADVLERQAELDFVEVISENFMIDGGRPLWVLDAFRERLPVALHGVSMSIGSADGLDRAYLRNLKRLADRVQPLFVSDHLCWTGVGGVNTHDLLPLPYTAEALDVVVQNVLMAQDVLQRPMLVENPSTYVTFINDEMEEADFLGTLCREAGCDILLDINNVYVSAANHGFDPIGYLRRLPPERVKQIHLAGHSQGEHLLIDTHDTPVCDDVWALYSAALALFGPVPTMVERDGNIPPFDVLLAEVGTARSASPAARSGVQ
jgi:uncharacterized protein